MPELPSFNPRRDLEQGINRGVVSLGSCSSSRALVPLPLLALPARFVSFGPAAPPLPATARDFFVAFLLLCPVSPAPLVPAVSRPSLDTRCASQVFLFQLCTQSADYPADPRILSRILPILLLSSSFSRSFALFYVYILYGCSTVALCLLVLALFFSFPF